MKRNLHLVLVLGYSGRLALFESQFLTAPVPMGLIVAQTKSPEERKQQLLEKYPLIPITLLPIEHYSEPVVLPLRHTLQHTDRIIVSVPPCGFDCITETRCRSPGKGAVVDMLFTFLMIRLHHEGGFFYNPTRFFCCRNRHPNFILSSS